MSTIQKIRERMLNRDYYVSWHAEEEMIDDQLERSDVVNAILKGSIERKLTQDMRGTRYQIAGPTKDGRLIHVICRFKEDGNLIIITAYAP